MTFSESEPIVIKIDEEMEKKVQIKKILVPIDGSNYSIDAARYAIELAKLQKAEINFIHIIEPLPYGVDYLGPTFDQYSKDVTNQVQSWFSKIRSLAKSNGLEDIKTEVFSEKRSITNTIIDYAQDESIDLIVMGTKGRTGFKRLLLGSIADGVAQHAHCPVLLVR